MDALEAGFDKIVVINLVPPIQSNADGKFRSPVTTPFDFST
jgi:hypothetical protein